MGVVNALLISAWALGLMCVWIWSVYDGANTAGHGWRITAALLSLANLAVVGAWMRGFSTPGGLLSCMVVASGAALTIVFVFWLRMRSYAARIGFHADNQKPCETNRHKHKVDRSPTSVTSPVASLETRAFGNRGSGYFLMAFGGIFAAAGAGVVILGFTSRQGSPPLQFRLDHPAFLVAMAGVVIGAALALVGRSVVRHAGRAN